jgi:hypothetical protein
LKNGWNWKNEDDDDRIHFFSKMKTQISFGQASKTSFFIFLQLITNSHGNKLGWKVIFLFTAAREIYLHKVTAHFYYQLWPNMLITVPARYLCSWRLGQAFFDNTQ